MAKSTRNIKISFLERDFFAGDRTGTTVRGYEPALIEVGGKVKLGRVIDPDRMGQSEDIDTELFNTTLPLTGDLTINLVELLGNNEQGKEWLDKLKKHSLYYSGEEIPTTLSINCPQIPPRITYALYPEDFFKKGPYYTCPRGFLTKLPETTAYLVVTPPMVIKDGKRQIKINFHRKVISQDHAFNGCEIRDSADKNPYKVLQGDIFGTLNERDLTDKVGDWKSCFPLRHYLDIGYSVGLREVRQLNPLTIRIRLAESFKN